MKSSENGKRPGENNYKTPCKSVGNVSSAKEMIFHSDLFNLYAEGKLFSERLKCIW